MGTHPILLVVVAALLVLVAAAVWLFNRLVKWRQNVRESWSAIDTELKRRYDLVPNLVQAVQGYAGHERQTLDAVMQARSAAAGNNGPPPSQAASEGVLANALQRLFVVAEAYPQLRASDGFRQLQAELAETETRISQARRFYNANVRELNTRVETFPSSIVARLTGFRRADYFEAASPERGAVGVQF